VSVGREAIFTCIVEDLGPYKVRRNIIVPAILFPRTVAAIHFAVLLLQLHAALRVLMSPPMIILILSDRANFIRHP